MVELETNRDLDPDPDPEPEPEPEPGLWHLLVVSSLSLFIEASHDHNYQNLYTHTYIPTHPPTR